MAQYFEAHPDNPQPRLLKQAALLLHKGGIVPRRVSHPSRKTIGLRVPDRKGLQLLLELHGAPLLATTLIPAGETEPLNDPQEIRERYEKLVDAIVDAGACPLEPTTVVDLTPMGTGGDPVVVREGRGSLQALGL